MSDLFLDEVIRPEPGAEPPRDRSARRAGREERERKRRRRRRRSIIAVLVSLALVGGGAYAAVTFIGPLIESFRGQEQPATDYPGPGSGAVQVVIPEGATGIDMAGVLHEADVVASERAFTRAFAANAEASGIQPGTYELAQQMKAADAVAALLDPGRRVQTKVTIAEGRTVEWTLEKLSSVTTVPVDEFKAAMEDPEEMGLPKQADGNYEGWLFPSTYQFEPGTTPGEMIRTMVQQTRKVLEENEVPKSDWQEVIIKASIIERESPGGDASLKMARAIENRLELERPLQIDAIVAFGLGKSGTELTLADISPQAKDNPYNSYAHIGLPPGPIAAPGEASIRAVLNPEPGDWLYWVTINLDTGETLFAETFSEHQVNEAKLRQWQAENQ